MFIEYSNSTVMLNKQLRKNWNSQHFAKNKNEKKIFFFWSASLQGQVVEDKYEQTKVPADIRVKVKFRGKLVEQFGNRSFPPPVEHKDDQSEVIRLSQRNKLGSNVNSV